MKKPDEIKKGLAICLNDNFGCNERCSYFGCESNGVDCASDMHEDALAYIQQLESDNESKQKRIDELKSRLAQAERERDALSYDMHQLQGALCAYCENLYRPAGSKKVSCKVFGDGYGAEDGSPLICGRFKWRGVCEENTKEG